MARHSLVAVGGSGQSAAIAYLRLATLSGIHPGDLPNIYVVDADIKDRTGADAKPSLYNSLKDLFDKLTHGAENKPDFKLIFPYAHQHGEVQGGTTFADYVLAQGGDRQETRYVIDSLFSKKTSSMKKHDLSEQDVPLSKGFMARPNVGATTFFAKLQQEQLERDLDTLKKDVTNVHGQNHVIVVIGSSFGGTGSGAAPSLAQQLVDWANEKQMTPKVGLFMTLPWFNPNAAQTNSNVAPTYGNSEIQEKNTAGGLHYYATSDSLKKVDVFIANYAGHIHRRNDDSNSEQPEYEHVFNLLLAAQIQNYFINKARGDDKFKQASTYTFYLPQNRLIFNAADSALLAFSVNDGLKQDLTTWLHEAQALRLALRYSANYMTKEFKPTQADRRNPPKSLVELAFKVAEQDGRPQMIIEKKKMLGFSSKKEPNPEIYNKIAEQLRIREQQLATSIAWTNRLKDNSPELNIDDASINENNERWFAEYAALNQYQKDGVEIASIRLFEEALNVNPNPNIIQDFETRTKNGQDAYTAAAVQIEAELRRVIRLRGANPRRDDENPAAGAGQSGDTTTVFLPLNVNGQSVSRYLQQIDLAKLVGDVGKDWQGKDIKVQDKNHPASLSNLIHSSVPSPWGTALLEEWQQKLAMDSKDKILLAQTAQRLEAILWGIFSNRLRVIRIPARQNESLLDMALKVRSFEVKGRGVEKYDWFTVAIDPQTQQVIAANYPTVGWFTAPTLSNMDWWDEPNEFFKGHFVLPTENEQNLVAEYYDTKLIKSFSDWLKSLLNIGDYRCTWYPVIEEICRKLDEKLPNNAVALAVSSIDQNESFILLTTSGCENIAIQRVEKTSQEILKDAVSGHLLVLENKIEEDENGNKYQYQYPDSPLSIKKHGATAKRIDETPLLFAEKQDKIKLRYLITLDGHQFIQEEIATVVRLQVQNVIFPNFKAEGWKLYFAGATPTENYDLYNVKFPQYAYHLYEHNGNKSSRVQYIQNGEKLAFEEQQPLHFDHNYELFGRPDKLVLYQYINGKYQEAGIFDIQLRDLPKELKSSFKLALDFGTSHSCVLAWDASNDGSTDLIRQIDFTRLNDEDNLLKKVFTTVKGDQVLFDEFNFIAPFAAKTSQDSLDKSVLPTEFRYKKQFEHEQPVENIDRGIRYLTILPMHFKAESALNAIKDNGAIGDFKWGIRAAKNIRERVYAGRENLLSDQYVKQILRMALIFLRHAGYTDLKTFRATYPEAFSQGQIRRFAEKLEDIFKQLKEETGVSIGNAEVTEDALIMMKNKIQGKSTPVRLTQHSHGLVSEAIAALEAAKETESHALKEKGLQIVLDMGGGSTDVAVFLQKEKAGLSHVDADLPWRITDSLRYAGHDVLQLLSTPNVIGELDKNSNDSLAYRVGVLKLAIRDNKTINSKLVDGFIDNRFKDEKQDAEAFFEGLFEYTRQLILSYQNLVAQYTEQPLSVGIVLLGNGWRLGRLIYTEAEQRSPIGALRSVMQDYIVKGLDGLDEKNIDILFPVDKKVSVKESICHGALHYNPRNDNYVSNAHNKRFSFVATTQLSYTQDHIAGFLEQQSSEFRDKNRDIEIVEFIKFPEYSKFNTRLEKIKGWEGNIQQYMKSTLNESFMDQWRSDEEDILINPMRDFLEVIWKKYVLFVNSVDE